MQPTDQECRCGSPYAVRGRGSPYLKCGLCGLSRMPQATNWPVLFRSWGNSVRGVLTTLVAYSVGAIAGPFNPAAALAKRLPGPNTWLNERVDRFSRWYISVA